MVSLLRLSSLIPLQLLLFITLTAFTAWPSVSLLAQSPFSNWYFYNGGISFNSGTPVALTNSIMNQPEGCATVSDANGQLLFYTDGKRAFDKNHQVMPNSLYLKGDGSSSNSAVIVPKPGSKRYYYIFTSPVNAIDGIYYSIVDLSLNNGNGDVMSCAKNVLIGQAPFAEKLTTALHDNGHDVWVIARKWQSSAFYAWQVTACGVQPAVISEVGLNIPSGQLVGPYGCLKISQQQNRLASANELSSSASSGGCIELFDFNNATGELSNAMWFVSPHEIDANGTPNSTVYGIEFSPGGQFLYSSSWLDDEVYQMDITLGTAADILASAQVIGDVNNGFGNAGAMQLADDGKIYIAQRFDTYLSVITDPDAAGIGCGFTLDAVDLSPKQAQSGLPAALHISDWNINPAPQYFSISGSCAGSPVQFLFAGAGCSGLLWHFGDPSSGSADTSTQLNPFHVFANAGTYLVTLHLTDGCFTDTLAQEVVISAAPAAILPPDTFFCTPVSLQLTAGNANDGVLWSTGDTANTITVTEPGLYFVTVENVCGLASDSVLVEQVTAFQPLFFSDTSFCIDSLFMLEVNAGNEDNSVSWNTGDTTSALLINSFGFYEVMITNPCGESISASFTVLADTCKFEEPVDSNENGSDDSTVAIPCDFAVPNAFSPNGDGVNDEFAPIAGCSEIIQHLVIFNRWGQTVYEGAGSTASWDGRFENREQEIGVYVYMLTTINTSGHTRKRKGHVTLLL